MKLYELITLIMLTEDIDDTTERVTLCCEISKHEDETTEAFRERVFITARDKIYGSN